MTRPMPSRKPPQEHCLAQSPGTGNRRRRIADFRPPTLLLEPPGTRPTLTARNRRRQFFGLSRPQVRSRTYRLPTGPPREPTSLRSAHESAGPALSLEIPVVHCGTLHFESLST